MDKLFKIQKNKEELKQILLNHKTIIVHIMDKNNINDISKLFFDYIRQLNQNLSNNNSNEYAFINLDSPNDLNLKYEDLEEKEIVNYNTFCNSKILFAKSFNEKSNNEIPLIRFSILLENKEKGILFLNSKLIEKNTLNVENPLIERLYPMCEILIDDENKIRTIISHIV